MMRRLLTRVSLLAACALPAVLLSAGMVFLLPPPGYFADLAAHAVTSLSNRAVAADAPASGPALERGGRRRSKTHSDGTHAPVTIRVATPARVMFMVVHPAKNADVASARRAIVLVGESAGGAQAGAWLAAQGFHVFDVHSALTTGPIAVDAASDIKCAVGWIKSHARERLGHLGVNVDQNRVALMGRKDAGSLALLSASAAGEPAPDDCAGDASIDAAISFYGPAQDVERVPLQKVQPGGPAILIVHNGKHQIGASLPEAALPAKRGPQGVFLQTVAIPDVRPGFDLLRDSLGEKRAEAAVIRFLAQVDERRGS